MYIKNLNSLSMVSDNYCYWHASSKFRRTKRSCAVLDGVGNLRYSEIMDARQNESYVSASLRLSTLFESASIES